MWRSLPKLIRSWIREDITNYIIFKRNTPQLAADGIKRIRIQLRDVSVGQPWLNAAEPLSDASSL